VSWTHSLHYIGDQSVIRSVTAQWGILKKKVYTSASWKSENICSNILLHFSDLTPIKIHNHAYNPVGIYFEKTGYKHTRCKLYFTQQQRTDNSGLVFKCCILHKIIVRYIKISAGCRISGLLAIRNECSFYSVQKDKNQDSPEKIRMSCY
jgi:hypothetical protein